MVNEPVDKALYNKTKKQLYKKYPKHSAYRSGLLVQAYKKAFASVYGPKKNPYTGTKATAKARKKSGLGRWFAEKWLNQRGEVGYKYKSDVYRPTKRITKKTPTTFGELSKKQIKRARTEKYKTGHVKRFKKN